MKKLILTLLLNIIYLNVMAQMSLSLPLPRSVFQRNASGQSNVFFGGQLLPGSPSNYSVKYRWYNLDKFGNAGSPSAWTYGAGSSYNGFFFFSKIFGTGWYEVEIGIFEGSNTYAGLTSTVKFGVGDVFFVAGQSNAQGIDGITNSAVTPTFYDCVNSVSSNQICKNTYNYPFMQKIQDGSIIAPAGNRSAWCYAQIGKRIADESDPGTVVPTLFFNAAFTGSSVSNWSETANNPNVTVNLPLLGGAVCCQPGFADWDSQGAEGHPYKTLRNSLGYYGGMFGAKTVLWHQGESDSQIASNVYENLLKNVVNKSREHFNPNLGWAISRASFVNGAVSASVISGQENAKNGLANTSTGAWNSDAILSRSDNTHFQPTGLVQLGDQYFTSFLGGYGGTSIKALPPVSALSPPPIAVSVTGSTITLTAMASGGYTYRWVQTYDGNISSPMSTNQSISVSNNQSRAYRCYVTDNLGRTSLSQAIYTPMKGVSTGARIGSSESEIAFALKAEQDYLPLTVAPNPAKGPITMTFTLRNTENVILELIELNGNVVSRSIQKEYSAGKHSFSFAKNNLPEGTYICRLQAGTFSASKKVVVIQ